MDVSMVLEAAWHGECILGHPLSWTEVNEDGDRYATCAKGCKAAEGYEVVEHRSNGLMTVEAQEVVR